MSTISREDLIANLRKSQVVESDFVDQWLNEMQSSAMVDGKVLDPPMLVMELVRRGKLTQWQAKFLLSGRHRLQIGNYCLLERTRRDQMGDTFLATHKQLDRKVDIQVLPVSLANDNAALERFISKAKLAANLDHLRLVHVYDIDQEGGRYFLVIEHAEGQSLQKNAAELRLSPPMVAQAMQQALDGLLYAHKQNVVHGGVSRKNLLLIDGCDIKIKNIAMSSLSHLVTGSAAGDQPEIDRACRSDDLQAIGNIGQELLLELKPAGSSQTAAGPLHKIFAELAEIPNGDVLEIEALGHRILDKLRAWVKENIPGTGEIGKSFLGSVAPQLVSTNNFGNVGTRASALPAQIEHAKNNDATETFMPHRLESAGQRRWIIRFLAMAAALVLIAGFGYLTLGRFLLPNSSGLSMAANSSQAEPTITSHMVRRESPVTAGKLTAQPGRQSSTDKLDVNEIKRQISELVSEDGTRPTAEVQASPAGSAPMPKSESANTVLAANENPQQPAEGANTGQVRQVNPAVDAPGRVMPGKISEIRRGDRQPEAGTDPLVEPNPDTAQPENLNPPSAVSVSPDVPAAPAINATDNPVMAKAVFADLPGSTQLPLVSSHAAWRVGNIYGAKNHLVAAELITGPQISTTKVCFELHRSVNDNQTWAVQFKKRHSDEPVDVARFWKMGDEFLFQWQPAAAADENVNYLRNCVLRLTNQNESALVKLREPLVIEGLAINEEQASVKIDVPLQWLPDPDHLHVELTTFQGDDLPGMFIDPSRADANAPARMFFHENAEFRFLWLTVAADSRSKLRLEASLEIQPAPGTKPRLAKPRLIVGVAEHIKQLADSASAEYAQNKDVVAPDGFKTKHKEWLKQLETDSNLAQEKAAAANALSQIVPNLYNRAIPVTVFFELNGCYIELARTNGLVHAAGQATNPNSEQP